MCPQPAGPEAGMNFGVLLAFVLSLPLASLEGDPIPEDIYEILGGGSVRSISDLQRALRIDSVEEDSSSPDLNATHPGPNPASLARERRSLGECGVLQGRERRAEIAVHVEVWTDGKKGLGLTRELGVKPQQGRRGSLELCRLLCFGSARRAEGLSPPAAVRSIVARLRVGGRRGEQPACVCGRAVQALCFSHWRWLQLLSPFHPPPPLFLRALRRRPGSGRASCPRRVQDAGGGLRDLPRHGGQHQRQLRGVAALRGGAALLRLLQQPQRAVPPHADPRPARPGETKCLSLLPQSSPQTPKSIGSRVPGSHRCLFPAACAEKASPLCPAPRFPPERVQQRADT
uniref:Platelet-derived growth factor N-terminal domain-containing protein n=1 Tax=Anas zonorhyncha TaxID=75864 RepID=A0A8B9UPH0_9AVES